MGRRKMSKKKVLNKTERLAIAKEQHIKWLLSIGVKLDKNGKVINNFKGYPMPDLSVRNSIPTSDRIPGCLYEESIDESTNVSGKTIGIAYNKGN